MLRALWLGRNGPSGEGRWLRWCIVLDFRGSPEKGLLLPETLLFTEFIARHELLRIAKLPARGFSKGRKDLRRNDILRSLRRPLAIVAIRAIMREDTNYELEGQGG